jgi:alpha-L-fucosidase
MTLNGHWGYHKLDDRWKSAETLVRNLIDVASKGGNFLLNVGPTGEGLIPAPSVERLQEVGRWMNANGEAIYGTTPGPIGPVSWGRSTARIAPGQSTVYLHVFEWPADGKLRVPGLKSPVRSASLLATGASLKIDRDQSGLTVWLPSVAPDKFSTTVVLK